MKKIDLNVSKEDLKLDKESEKITGFGLAKNIIESVFVLKQNEPDPRTGRPKGMKINEHRKINKVLDAIDKSEDGIVEFEDDHYDYLKRTFSDIEWPGSSRLFVRVSDRIEAAQVEKEE